jgi:putative nucleotidyltransferase with HDIG domain
VVFLGRKHLQSAVLTAGVSRFFQASRGGYVEKGKELWEHSVAVALMSQILSRHLRRREDPVLYTAALMHDIGKLLLGEFVHDAFEQIGDLMSRRGCSFLEAEEEILGINHAELGGRIADQWNFPPQIRDGIAHHHRPDLVDDPDSIAGLIYLSDQFCLMAGIAGGVDGLAHRGIGSIMRKYTLREADLERNLITLLDELDRAEEVLRLVH